MSAGELTGIELQPRDWDLLRGLFESRVMTLDHITTLYFPSKEMAKKRIQKLKSAGLIRERPRRVPDPSVLLLTRKGFEQLNESDKLADLPKIGATAFDRRALVSPLTLRHELEVMDVKVAMLTAIGKTDRFEIAEFSTWPLLYQFKSCRSDGQGITVKPDGFIRIHEKESDGSKFEYAFFLEVDIGHETLDRVVEKCLAYRYYSRTGGFAVFCDGQADDPQSFPFRVLIVCQSEERRNNLAERLLEAQPPFSMMILIATQTECETDPMGDIWLTPASYKEAEPERRLGPMMA